VNADNVGQDVERRQAPLLKKEKALQKNVSDLLEGTAGEHVEDRILDAVRQVTALAEKQRDASELLNTLNTDLRLKRQTKENKDAQMRRLAVDLETITTTIAKDGEALEKLRLEIRDAAGTDDPAPERDRVQEEISRLEKGLHDARESEIQAQNRLVLAQNNVNTCTQELASAERKAQDARKRAVQALEEAGFPQPTAARAASRAPDRLKALKDRITDHENQVRDLTSAIDELETELKGSRISEEEASRAQAEYDGCLNRKQQATGQLAVLKNKIQDMKDRLEKAARLRDELADQTRRHTIYHQLAADLKSDKFQAFLLEETLASLLRDASIHLGRLTDGRYGLHFENDRMFVIDNDNAGEHRAIDSLSGGETFQASLALALALSEQVQKSVGAVRLDCLFIDEGFGTLDPETLRTVSDAIRGLQVGHRMVGIITHVPELKEEFEQRIVVAKQGGVSTVRVELT
jgi:exonuclease SbcC